MSDEKKQYGGGLAIAAGVLLAIYVFLPFAFLIPLKLAMEHNWISVEVWQKSVVIFVPIEFITVRSPAYKRLLDEEHDFCAQHGLFGP
jgi:hypothetical protein